MLGSWAAGMKHSFFTFKIYTCQYLTKIRTVPETIKTAILIKCVKPIQCPWYIKEFKNFNNNSNIQKKNSAPDVAGFLSLSLSGIIKPAILSVKYQTSRSSHKDVFHKTATQQLLSKPKKTAMTETISL